MSLAKINKVYHAPNVLWHYRIPTYKELDLRLERLDVAYIELEKDISSPPSSSWNVGVVGGYNPFGYALFVNYATLKALKSDCDCLLLEWNLRNISLIPTTLIARFIQKKKVLWWGHGESKVPSLFTKLTIAAGKYLPDSVIVYMDNTKRSLVAENKYKDDKTFVAKNGIDVKTIRHAISKIETKRRSNWGTAYSGRLNEGRDLERIVHSISHLNKKGIECKHFFIGEGNARVKLEKLAEQLGVADKIVFCGAVHCADDLAAIYAQVDLVVIPGWLGLVIHQAFAFAKPVLICDKKELHNPEIALFDKTNGWVYSHEADDLAETLETVFELGKETINSKGDNCQQLVINEYSTQKMVDGLIEAIHYG